MTITLKRRAVLRGTLLGLFATAGCVGAAQPVRAQEAPAGEFKPALLVLYKGENSLAIVDPATLKVLGKVAVGEGPHEVIASLDGRLAFVANYGNEKPDGTLSVIDVAARKEVKRVGLGLLQRPHGLAVSGTKLYFTAETNRAIARYDIQSGQMEWMLGVGEGGAHMIVATPDGEKLYTANILTHTVSAIDLMGTPQGETVKQIPVGKGPEGMALSPDGKELWIGHRSGGLRIIDTAADKVKETLADPGVYLRIAFSLDGKYVLAGNAKTNEVVIWDAATRKELKRLDVGPGPGNLAFNADGKTAYVVSIAGNQVSEIDLGTLKVGRAFETGELPDGIAWAGPVRNISFVTRPRGSLGVAVAAAPDGRGLLVQQVFPGSAADKAGLKPGDRVLTLNGEAMNDTEPFVQQVYRSRAGDEFTLELERAGAKQTVKAVLAPRPKAS